MIYVTGGTGFLGRHLIPALSQAGYTVRVLTRHPESNLWLKQLRGVEVVFGDLKTGEGIDAMAGCRYVIHAASLFSMWEGAGDFKATNVYGTSRLLDKAIHENIERFIYVSTVAVAGNPRSDAILDETYPPQPADAYQRSKYHAEQLVNEYHQKHGLNAVILRPGAYYGPLGEYAFNRLFFTDPMRGIIMQMDGGRYIIFPAYITDVVQGILLALEKGRVGEIYNIAGDWISHKAVFDIVCEEANLHWPRLNLPGWLGINFSRFLELVSKITGREPFYPIGLQSYVFNNWRVSSEKAKCELGFRPTDFREGVRCTLDWYRRGKPEILPEIYDPQAP